MNTSSKIALLLLVATLACKQKDKSLQRDNADPYYILDLNTDRTTGKTMLPIAAYQQTTDYTCGPAAALTLLDFLGRKGNEIEIAKAMGTDSISGTSPDQMTDWLITVGIESSWSEGGTLQILRANLERGQPTLVEWSDWGGHWALVIGYDTRNTETTSDDVIIFADPYDQHDGNPDGITWFNAERFYYMWYDALLFDKTLKQVYVTFHS